MKGEYLSSGGNIISIKTNKNKGVAKKNNRFITITAYNNWM